MITKLPTRRALVSCLSRSRYVTTTTQLSAVLSPAHTETRLPSIKQQCREIRDRVVEECLGVGVIYLSAGELAKRNADVFYKFRPDSNFAYVTGYSEPGAGCLLDTETGKYTLLLPNIPEDMQIWIGGSPCPDAIGEEYGADRVAYMDDLAEILNAEYPEVTIHTLEGMENSIPKDKRGRSRSGAVVTDMLPRLLGRCRAVKTEAEVECLREANRVSSAAHMAMWRHCRPGMREYQLEAVFVQQAMDGGLFQTGYPPIVGAGKNAAVLHYERNNAVVGEQDLVLVDAGSEFRCYTADITRTFPASGRYTAEQRAIYDVVLEMQHRALRVIAPGAQWKDVDGSARVVMLQRLKEMGLVRGSVDALLDAKVDRVFMPHGVGHHLGLDVHDVGEGLSPLPQELRPGNVVTCEPGVYFMDLFLGRAAADTKQAELIDFEAVEKMEGVGGVRIEDNVVVTTDGLRNLTMEAGCLKAAAEIEEYMRR